MNEIENIETVISSSKFIRESSVSEIDKYICRLNNLLIIKGMDYQYKRKGKKILKVPFLDYFNAIKMEQNMGKTFEELRLERYKQNQENLLIKHEKQNKDFSVADRKGSLTTDERQPIKKLVMKIENFSSNKIEDDLPF